MDGYASIAVCTRGGRATEHRSTLVEGTRVGALTPRRLIALLVDVD